MGGAFCVAHTQEKRKFAKVHSITSPFRHEDFVRTKLFLKVCQKSMDKAFYSSLNSGKIKK